VVDSPVVSEEAAAQKGEGTGEEREGLMVAPKESIGTAKGVSERRKKKESWLKRRKDGIGASEAAAVCGLSRYRTPIEAWRDKVTVAINAEDVVIDDEENEAIYWGNKLESDVRHKARTHFFPGNIHGIVNPGRFKIQRHAEHRWMTATLDGWLREPTDRIRELFEGFPVTAMEKVQGRGVLEIKCSGQVSEWGENPDDYPIEYQCQVQHAMAVMGYSWGILACLLSGYGGMQVRYFPFVAVDDFQQLLMAREADFWHNHVETRVAPDIVPVNLPGQIESLQSQFAAEIQGKVVELETNYVVIDEIKQAAVKLRSQADAIDKFCKAALIARMQDGEMGVLDNGAAYTYKTQERKGFEVKPRTDRVLRRTVNSLKIDVARGVVNVETKEKD
jgi:putative phage-type endonuclease